MGVAATALHFNQVETEAHSLRVANYAAGIARILGLTPEEIRLLRIAARMHDIGKRMIPVELLLKPGALSLKEREVVEGHVLGGYQILKRYRGLDAVRSLVLTHHERYDGHGYPHAVRGSRLPLVEQVLPVADSLDAMTSDRPYSARRSFYQALAELRRGAGTQWNPRVVSAAHAMWFATYSGRTVSAVRQQYQAATVRNGL